ncbi:hypothetical protein [Serratia sp. 201]|uniref:hypothetical protein n=1 Tax=Serratia sp. 201 TaxID=3096764 RepID=UPI003009CD3E
MIEGAVVKKVTSKTVDEFCALECKDRAQALLCAAELATSELAGKNSHESMLVSQIMISPFAASANDCMAIFDRFLDDFTKIERISKGQLRDFERSVGDVQFKFIKESMHCRLMAMRIILFILADGADKIGGDIGKRFYLSLHESNKVTTMIDAANVFIERKLIENSAISDESCSYDEDVFRYKNIITSWDASGIVKHIQQG